MKVYYWNELPNKVRLVIEDWVINHPNNKKRRNILIEEPENFSCNIPNWIRWLKVQDIFTNEIGLELFPLLFGEE
jgi:hypothetical protein